MKPTIYIETTIPSYYFNSRGDAELKVLSQWTREWWDGLRKNYELVSSSAVIDELRDGEHPFKQEKIALMREVKLLAYVDQISEIENAYIARKAMPNDPRGDALHLAYASFYKCDILLSWNCRHIVNPNKAEHIEKLNTEMKLHIPRLVTPFELLKKEVQQ
jgi:hypothetical protein